MLTAMSSITRNNTMDLFYLLKENYKNLLFYSLITVWKLIATTKQ